MRGLWGPSHPGILEKNQNDVVIRYYILEILEANVLVPSEEVNILTSDVTFSLYTDFKLVTVYLMKTFTSEGRNIIVKIKNIYMNDHEMCFK